MHIVPGFLIRQIAGEFIAVPSGEAAHHLSGLVSLSRSGKFLFELLQTEQTHESLVSALLDRFDVDPATAEHDVAAFVAQLQEHDILVTD